MDNLMILVRHHCLNPTVIHCVPHQVLIQPYYCFIDILDELVSMINDLLGKVQPGYVI